MPELEYTLEVVSDISVELPDGQTMQRLVTEAIVRWNPDALGSYLDVQVTRVSDDL